MANEKTSLWGTKIERGLVLEIETVNNNTNLYTVESIDRPGVIGYKLPCFTGSAVLNSTVYFFLFNDGTGGVIGQLS